MQLLKRILTAVLLIPVVLLLVLRAPVPVLALVAALVALLAVQELLKISEAYKIIPMQWPTYIFVGLFFLFLAVHLGQARRCCPLPFLPGLRRSWLPSRRLFF